MAQKITLTGKDGFRLGANLVEPEKKARGGVVICQEIFGFTDYLKSACEFYADAGYMTIAPQFFDRIERDVVIDYTLEGIDRGLKFAAKADWNVALDDLEAARQYLERFPSGAYARHARQLIGS